MVGRKSGRLHHLLSGNLEQAAFLEFDWSDAVAEIREQFPLDRDETREIAAEMGISHPRDPKTQVDMVMTTDFVLDIHSQEGTYLLAWAIKPAEELRSRRTIDKLEIERRYWERRKVGWRLSSEPELPFQRAQNLRFLNGQKSLDDVDVAYTGL